MTTQIKTMGELEQENPADFQNPKPTKAMVWVDVREGRKLVGSNKAPLAVVQKLMLDSGLTAEKVMVETARLREGRTVNFKHKGKSATIKPLIGHTDLY